jgi:outer membrane receptor protein involved in Fe transport
MTTENTPKPLTMNKPKFASWALAILASPLLINLTYGQTTPTAAPTAETTDAGSTDLLKLDDFIVTSDAASGYRATSSTSATGIGTPTGDTPASIFIVTKDFISDNRLDLINDAVRYVPGVITAPNNESQPFIRGFQGAYSLRNGVFVRQNLLTWDVSDVEVIEGASSIFYSNIRPGGILNYNTIKPVLGQTFTDLTQDFGSYEYRRTEAAFNYGTNDFAFRLDLGSSDQYTFRVGNNERQTFFDASVLWKITTNQALTIEYAVESVYRANGWSAFITPLTNTRYWQNPAAIASGLSVSAWMAKNYPGVPVYNEYAPFSPSIGDPYGRITPIITNYQSGMDKPLDVNYTAKILDNLVFDVVLNYNWEDNEGTNPNPADPLANGTFAGFNEQRFINIRDSYNANTRLTYRLNVAKTENTLMVGNDNQWAIKRMPSVSSLNIPTNGNPPTVSSNNQQTASFTYNPVTMGTLNGAALLALPTTNNFNSVQDSAQHFGGT